MSSTSKIMPAEEAVKKFVSKGDCISLGGFTVNRNPIVLVHEVLRQKIDNLHAVMHSGSQALDLLIGEGLIKLVEIAYGANGRFASTCVRFRKAVEQGSVTVEDYTNYQITLRFMAGAMGIPYLPTYSGLGSDIIEKWGFNEDLRKSRSSVPNKKLIVGNDPFTDSPLVLVPAVNPDVTLLHVHQASEDGVTRIEGLTFADIEQARAAKHVIVSCEEIVSSEELRKEPWRNCFPHTLVDAVVHQPFGSHPTACYLRYDYDDSHLNEYRELASYDKKFVDYLETYVYGVSNFNEYLELIGRKRLDAIRATPNLGYRKRRNSA
ncbi:MAG: CoA transferase subunit A [Candidatus Thorarchaeota archaeon]|nr:MAG: CoA transferase subunit A [Candidatus Thorarchaeota archaeon]